jgi:CobQ-like glutamine amidotransferase family enzyme
LAVSAEAIERTLTGTDFELVMAGDRFPVRLSVPGLFNTYNAVAAAATSLALGIQPTAAIQAIEGFRGAFGRFERVAVSGRTVVVVLAKNPVGMNEALRTVADSGDSGDLLLALNDLDADGRDVSWIWDADFEILAGRARRVTVSGRRATDLAMRLAYAGVGAPDDVDVVREVVEGLADSLDHALAGAPIGGTVAAVVTYTAMLELRQVLVARGHATAYWTDAGVSTPVRGTALQRLSATTRTSPSADRTARGALGTRNRGTSAPFTPRDSEFGGTGQLRVPARVSSAMPETGRRIRVGHFYADLLNLYADRGNVMALRRRCEWRQIGFEVVRVGVGDRIVPGEFDLAFLGGGQDGDQAYLADDLFRVKADGLRGLVADGVPVLAVCGSYQLLGHYYDPATGTRMPGLGLFDLHTAHPGPQATRCIGNVVVEWEAAPPRLPRTLVGFENHGGRTWLGKGAKPFARVVTGYGNNGVDRTEGIVVGNAIGTYIHGSLLPKNPHLADRLISLALDPSGSKVLEPLDDTVEWRAHETVLARFSPAKRLDKNKAR